MRTLARIILYVRAGGKCEFAGCNQDVLENPLTRSTGNFGQAAHIVAFREGGPRGRGPGRPLDINVIDNLMLLCPQCHLEIDVHKDEYSRARLRRFKREHEHRIHHLTGLPNELRTAVVQFKARIGDQAVSISPSHMTAALLPRYPFSRLGTVIDLAGTVVDGEAVIQAGVETIRKQIRRLYDDGGEADQSGHISLFAIGPMSLLMFLGSQLSNKVPVDLFQRHRDSEDWKWKSTGSPAKYQFRRIRTGSDPSKVALLLSLSGTIHETDLPKNVDATFSVYEITLDGLEPTPHYLRLRADLVNFGHAYHGALSSILGAHPGLPAIHLFPAVPAPIAVMCGRELLPKVYLTLFVYDRRPNDGFVLQLRINESANPNDPKIERASARSFPER